MIPFTQLALELEDCARLHYMVAEINHTNSRFDKASKFAEIVVFLCKGIKSMRKLYFDAMILAADSTMRMHDIK